MVNIKNFIGGLFLGFTMMTIFSCSPKVLFYEPSPPELENLMYFPETFHGMYQTESDSNLLVVTSNLITTNSEIHYKTTLKRIRESENCAIVDGGVHLLGRKECFPFKFISEDTILVTVAETDTIFMFDENHVAKTYGNDLYLNYKNAQNEWLTFVVMPSDIDDGSYTSYLITIENNKRTVGAITDNFKTFRDEDDNEIFVINPSIKEFKSILKNKHNLKFHERISPINFETTKL